MVSYGYLTLKLDLFVFSMFMLVVFCCFCVFGGNPRWINVKKVFLIMLFSSCFIDHKNSSSDRIWVFLELMISGIYLNLVWLYFLVSLWWNQLWILLCYLVEVLVSIKHMLDLGKSVNLWFSFPDLESFLCWVL